MRSLSKGRLSSNHGPCVTVSRELPCFIRLSLRSPVVGELTEKCRILQFGATRVIMLWHCRRTMGAILTRSRKLVFIQTSCGMAVVLYFSGTIVCSSRHCSCGDAVWLVSTYFAASVFVLLSRALLIVSFTTPPQAHHDTPDTLPTHVNRRRVRLSGVSLSGSRDTWRIFQARIRCQRGGPFFRCVELYLWEIDVRMEFVCGTGEEGISPCVLLTGKFSSSLRVSLEEGQMWRGGLERNLVVWRENMTALSSMVCC